MVAKFKVEITHPEFSQLEHDYSITLTWGHMGGSRVFKKSDLISDEEHNIYIVFDTSEMFGKVMAECLYEVPDTDRESGVREECDRQWLAFVASTPCVYFPCDCECAEKDPHVVYTRVYRSDVHTLYLNLRTTEDNGEHLNLLDSEGQQLRVHKRPEDIY